MLPAVTTDFRDDPERLFGRDRLVGLAAGLLAAGTRNRVVAVHGEAGCGKSALAAVLAEQFRAAGDRSEAVEVVGPLAQGPGGRRLLVVDPPRSAVPVSDAAWHALISSLGAEDRLLVVSRQPPELPVDDARLVELRVAPLSWDDSVEVLRRERVAAEDRAALVRWAAGVPLLLVLGAQIAALEPEWQPGSGPEPAALADRVARRLGPSAPPAGPAPPTLDAAATLAAAAQAVRDYQAPDRLAGNPLAAGDGNGARVEHLRTQVDAAVARAFGSARRDVALREVLVAGYLVAAVTHEQLAFDLHLSRSTYFRYLSTAVRRVAVHLADASRDDAREPAVA